MLTLREAKQHLRLEADETEEDEYLLGLIETATASVLNDIKRTYDGPVPPPVKHAALLLLGHLYSNREAASDKPLTAIPFAIKHLLSPYRRLV